MSTEIARREDGPLQLPPGVQTTPVGLVLPDGISEDDWNAVGNQLSRCSGALQWWVGDWGKEGTRRYGDLKEKAETLGFAYNTVASCEYVSGKYELCRRRQTLSFDHHKEVASLPNKERDRWLDKAEKHGWSKAELRKQVRNHRLAQSRKDNPLPQGIYNVVYADPPWRYEFSVSDSRKIENQYPTMELEDIQGLTDCDGKPVTEIFHDDCVLFLWATSPKLDQSIEVIESWGFSYRTCMVWDKEKIGMGYYARQQHELLLIGVKGTPSVPPEEARPGSVVRLRRDEIHSRKPEEFYGIIERMYPHANRVELFCRTPRDGWSAWGNEVPANA